MKKQILKTKNEIAGITLIALVITIIVLLILAAVSISTLTGENGILTKASDAKNDTQKEGAKEKVQMEVLASYGTDAKIDIDLLNKNLSKIEGLTYNGSPISINNKITKEALESNEGVIVNVDDYDVIIDEKGNVFVKDEKGETETPPEEKAIVSARDIANSKDKSKYYGAYVNGYECNETISWKILYADENNIYLIASDFIDLQYPTDETLEGYRGLNDITDSRIKALNKDYFEKNYESTGNHQMKQVAYMLDTSVWSNFIGEKADYAIGGPTIELLLKSYNQKYNTNYLAQATSNLGYSMIQGNSSHYGPNVAELEHRNDELYFASYGTLIASPVSSGNRNWFIGYFGIDDGSNQIGYNVGFCPVVCLNSSVQLEKENIDIIGNWSDLTIK